MEPKAITSVPEVLQFLAVAQWITRPRRTNRDVMAECTNLVTGFRQETKTWAAFGQADFDLTDTLTVTAGARWTEAQKTAGS